MTTKRYAQKVDGWIGALFGLILGSFLFAIPSVPNDEVPILVGSAVAIAVFVLPFLYGYVELREDELFVRCGWLFQHIPYANIQTIEASTNLYSSMALSIHRIRIVERGKPCWRGVTYIAPKDRETVIEELRWRVSQSSNEA
jgi:flagellar biosynthesis protein FliR